MGENIKATPKKEVGKRGSILVVDDEKYICLLIQKILQMMFDVRIATSGEAALKLIQDGYKPNVIISDYLMAGMNGGEFLAKSIEYSPLSVRILLSADSNPKVILPLLMKAKAKMYIHKPFNKLELFQSTVMANDLSNSNSQLENTEKLLSPENSEILDRVNGLESGIAALNSKLALEGKKAHNLAVEKAELETKIKELAEELKGAMQTHEDDEKIIEKLKIVKQEAEKVPAQAGPFEMPRKSVLAISAIIRELNRFSYTDHSYAVAQLCKEMCKELKFSEQETIVTINAALLHNFAIMGMPNYFQVANPLSLKGNEQERYFHFFNKQVRILKHIVKLEVTAEIIAQLWERNDSTGKPKRLGGDLFRKEAQVLSIANLYVFHVYRASDDDFREIKKKLYNLQGPKEAKKRHTKALNMIEGKPSWYNREVFDVFMDLMKHEKTVLMGQLEVPGKIDIRELVSMDNLRELPDIIHEIDNMVIDTIDEELILDYGTSDGQPMLKRSVRIRIDEMMPNMILSESIKSNNGSVILRKGTVLDIATIKNIKGMDSKGMIKSEIHVLTAFNSLNPTNVGR